MVYLGTGTGTSIWPTWTSATTATTFGSVWERWIPATTSTTTTASTWYVWNDTYGHQRTLYVPNRQIIAAPVLTPEQIESERRMAEERERKWKAERAARKLAEETAQELLMNHLTPEQRQMVKDKKFMVVEGGKSKSKYRVWTDRGVHGNIERLCEKGEKVVESWCVQLHDKIIPNYDHFLAQKLMLELAEEDIMKVANKTRRYG